MMPPQISRAGVFEASQSLGVRQSRTGPEEHCPRVVLLIGASTSLLLLGLGEAIYNAVTFNEGCYPTRAPRGGRS